MFRSARTTETRAVPNADETIAGMVSRRSVPWIILLGALGWFAILSIPHGPSLLLVLLPAWILVVTVERRVVRRLGSRRLRLAADVVLAGLCLLLLTFGGLWVLPAVVAFGIVDLADSAPPDARPTLDQPRRELLLGIGTAIAILATLALILYAPLYSTAGAAISTTGVVTETQSTASLAEVGFPLALELLLVGLAGAALFGVILDARRAADGRPLIGFVAAALAILAILGGFSIGLFLVPAGVMAALTFAAAGTTRGGRG